MYVHYHLHRITKTSSLLNGLLGFAVCSMQYTFFANASLISSKANHLSVKPGGSVVFQNKSFSLYQHKLRIQDLCNSIVSGCPVHLL